MDWKFEYCYGDTEPQDAVEGDIISAVEYDTTGRFIALGDRAGRITVLERRAIRENGAKKDTMEFRQHIQFQSHDPEFDYLKSVEIEEKINQIQWLKQKNAGHMLLSTNDKTVKLWKISSKQLQGPSVVVGSPMRCSSLFRRQVSPMTPVPQEQVRSHLRYSYANAHAYHINSISLSSDSETFLSADDLRINIWHLDHKESLNVVDIKPPNMEDLTEVITSASYHPQHCSQFVYSTSKGTMKMGDLREASTIQRYCRSFEMEEEPSNKTFFSEIISSISDCKFGNDCRYLLSRDYLTLKIWDVNMEIRPIRVLNMHEALRARLCDVYENDCIFDKFECRWSGDSRIVFTGSYKNNFKVSDVTSITSVASPKSASKSPQTMTFEAVKPKNKKKLGRLRTLAKTVTTKSEEDFEKADFNKKVLHLAVHPHEYEVAVSCMNHLYVFRCATG
jgi:serine/threonine-protein phosphatase 2A regulatory subunit B